MFKPYASRVALRAHMVVLMGATFTFACVAATGGPVRSPAPDRVDVVAAYMDNSPVTITIDWAPHPVPWTTTVEDVRSGIAIWRSLRLRDWNHVPPLLRRQALENMLRRYAAVGSEPERWAEMNAQSWDRVPQPVRIVAFRRMIDHWCRHYAVGTVHGLPASIVSDTVAAIVMSESWFDHRAEHLNPDGTRDIGLAGASAFARRRLRTLQRSGRVDAAFTEADYINPFVSTRFAGMWMALMLDEAKGDLSVAIGAYNRGIARATDERGVRYQRTVQERLQRFILNQDAPAGWNELWRVAKERAVVGHRAQGRCGAHAAGLKSSSAAP